MPPKSTNWLAIRTAYVVKGWTAQRCSQEFGIDPTTIRKRASKEGWTQERHRITTEADVVATTVATETAQVLVGRAVADIRADHANLVAQLHTVLNGADQDIEAANPGRSRAEVRRLIAETYTLVLKGSRMVLGISEGQSSIRDEEQGPPEVIAYEVPELIDAAPDNLPATG